MHRLAVTLICLALAASFSPLNPAAAAEEEGAVSHSLTFDQIFPDQRPERWPAGVTWRPDGEALLYLQPAEEGDDSPALWSRSATSGEAQVTLSAAQVAEALGDEDAALSGLQFSEDGSRMLLAAGDARLSYDPSAKTLKSLQIADGAEDIRLSPDGKKVAFVHEADLHVLDLGKGKAKALTTDGEEGVLLNGKPDWVYWEEIWGRRSVGYFWSPDSSKIAFYQFDETPVGTYTLLDYLPTYPERQDQKYPKTGSDNPKVRLGVLPAKGGKPVWLKTEAEEESYLARVHWYPDGSKVAVERLNRDQNRLDILLCDATSGKCSTLLTEEWPTWINLGDEFTFLSDGRFVRASEKNGYRHLYLHAADGSEIRPLSIGKWSVTSLEQVDEETGWVVFTGHAAPGSGAAQRRVYRSRLDREEMIGLTGTQGWNTILPAPGQKAWLHTFGDANAPNRTVLLGANGQRITEVERLPKAEIDAKALPQWEFITLWSSRGTKLAGRILKPANFDPQRKYPVIMYHYGGPGSQVVVNRWSWGARDLWHKMMAQRGYIVFSVDNEASVFFGKAGEDKAYRRFGPVNLDGQLAGVDYLRKLDYVDDDRIGLWGWSGGGTHTLYCLMNSPGTWAAGVSGAPVTDWRLYDTIWTERYLDTPQSNPEGYRDSSPVTYAEKLNDPILIVHGTADDNVHPQNTYVMTDAWVKAGIPFEMAIYPGEKHGFAGKASRHFYERMTEFFDRHLKAPADAP